MKGATLSGEFVEIVLQKRFTSKVCAKYICTYTYMQVCTCVHVWVRGESTVLQPFQAERSELLS